VVRLVRDYRSTPQVVGLANQVIQAARGAEARLRLELSGQRPPGPPPQLHGFPDEPAEAAAVAARCAELIAAGTPAREIAVLFRTNAQSEAYEEALTEAAVPYTVQGAARFFERPEVRQALVAIRAAARSAAPDTPLPAAAAEALAATGWSAGSPPPGGAARERWEALAALVRLAEEHRTGATGPEGLLDFHAELMRRAAAQHVPTVEGVTLASLHSAKGLEWDAVFLVGLVEGMLPVGYARTDEQVEEERRLLYVGITRAREWLWLSWPAARAPGGRPRRPSRFLPVLRDGQAGQAGITPAAGRGPSARSLRSGPVTCRVCGAVLVTAADRKIGRCASCPSTVDEELLDRLRGWRARVAAEQKVPTYVVFTDATLTALAERTPDSNAKLVEIPGIGARKLGLYGPAVIALVGGAKPDEV
jgi:DNA helicase-2/ATP-dependent DNA helicase PcrA